VGRRDGLNTPREAAMLDAASLVARVGDDGVVIPFGTSRVTYKVLPSEAAGRFEMFQFDMPAGGTAPQVHIHRRMEELFYVASGTLRFVLGDRDFLGGPGSLVLIPRGEWHGVSNGADAPARALVMFSPANDMVDYFRQLSALLSAPHRDDDAIRELTKRYDSERREGAPLVLNTVY
jgi:quercetin dioxygenase-like cupin family protein